MPDIEESKIVSKAISEGAVPDGYQEVETEFFQFKSPGDSISGRLIDKGRTRVREGEVGKYTLIKLTEGRKVRVTFLGSTILDEKLRVVATGSEVYIQYTHEETVPDKNYKMKSFKVFVKT